MTDSGLQAGDFGISVFPEIGEGAKDVTEGYHGIGSLVLVESGTVACNR